MRLDESIYHLFSAYASSCMQASEARAGRLRPTPKGPAQEHPSLLSSSDIGSVYTTRWKGLYYVYPNYEKWLADQNKNGSHIS